MFDGIIDGIQNFVRSLMYGPLSVTLNWLESIVDIILNEIAGYDFINLDFITNCYKISLAAALVLLPLKLIYEWLWLVIGNDVEKWSQKLFAIIQIAIVLVATPPVLTKVTETIQQLNTAIMSGEVINGHNTSTTITAGKGFSATVLTATTSLNMTEAENFVNEYNTPEFDINARDEDDNYIYNFDFIMPMIVCLIMVVLMFFVGMQMAFRIVSVGFIKILMPIASLSLTNKDNPNAFIVARNALASNIILNTVQIFLLVFMFAIISQLDSATPLAKLLFTIALVLAIMALPNVVSAMIGGYGGGIMDSLQMMQNVMYTSTAAFRGTKALGRTVRNTGARAGSIATKAAKGTFNSMRNAPTSSAKVLGKGMSAAGSAKDRIVQGKEALKNMDQSIKTHGTNAKSNVQSNGFVKTGRDYLNKATASAGGYVKGKAGNFKDNVLRQKNLSDANRSFKKAPVNPLVVNSKSQPYIRTNSQDNRSNATEPSRNTDNRNTDFKMNKGSRTQPTRNIYSRNAGTDMNTGQSRTYSSKNESGKEQSFKRSYSPRSTLNTRENERFKKGGNNNK